MCVCAECNLNFSVIRYSFALFNTSFSVSYILNEIVILRFYQNDILCSAENGRIVTLNEVNGLLGL
jgi:hypothetical protein